MTARAPEIRVGMGTCGRANGAEPVFEAVHRETRRMRLDARVKAVGCAGRCHAEPLMEIVDGEGKTWSYGAVKPRAVAAILEKHFPPATALGGLARAARRATRRLLGQDGWERPEQYALSAPPRVARISPSSPRRIALENSGNVDPLCLDEHLERGGYQTLREALTSRTPAQVIDVIKRSGLRGRGGGGFPTGRKWELTGQAGDPPRYVICNADEGDPGAFMDRLILESDPHRVLEGLAVAAYAVGAHEGFVFVREEYPLAVHNAREAIRQAEERGYLGDDILGSSFSLRLKVIEGAGAFVCGEETALIHCIEGRGGSPRLRPPYPAHEGLWGRPTLVNNVETLACVPWILREGAEAFASMGTPGSPGAKVFALAGKVKRGGLIEAPMGATIREIVFDIGGGIPDGRAFKGVQIGGPAGGCIPAELADTPVDYEEVARLGAIMGSGGLLVLDDTDCMVDIARFFLEFTQTESCGKCVFCRIGTKRMVEILNRLCNGETRPTDLEHLEVYAEETRRASLCGLGQNAANPVITTLRYFPEEYEAHAEGRCPAGRCRALIRYRITDRCIGCTICAQGCPTDAIEPIPYEQHEIDPEKCVKCGMCRSACPADAIEVVS